MGPSPAPNKFLCTVIRTTHFVYCRIATSGEIRGTASKLVFWGAGMEFLLHQALVIPGTVPLESPGFPPDSWRILLDSLIPKRARLWHANMQTPFRGENRIITFHAMVTFPFLVTASGKQAGAAAMLVLLGNMTVMSSRDTERMDKYPT